MEDILIFGIPLLDVIGALGTFAAFALAAFLKNNQDILKKVVQTFSDVIVTLFKAMIEVQKVYNNLTGEERKQKTIDILYDKIPLVVRGFITRDVVKEFVEISYDGAKELRELIATQVNEDMKKK